MTTLAEQLERLAERAKTLADLVVKHDHKRGCGGRASFCTCGLDPSLDAAAEAVLATLRAGEAEG